MSYNSFGVEQFKNRMQEGKYTTFSNAKRAVGRAVMADAEKEACIKLAAKHFGPQSAAPKPGKKKSMANKRAATKKKAQKAKPNVATKKTVKKAAVKATRAVRREPNKKAVTKKKTRLIRHSAAATTLANIDEQGRRISYLTASIEAMKLAKDVKPDIDLGPGPQAACEALGAIIQQIHNDVRALDPEGTVVDQAVVERLTRTAPPVSLVPSPTADEAPSPGEPTAS